jgi:hypothetical protein
MEEYPQAEFIRAKLEHGLTLVQLARTQRNNHDMEAATEAIGRAELIASNAEVLVERLDVDGKVKAELMDRLSYLLFAINSFSN